MPKVDCSQKSIPCQVRLIAHRGFRTSYPENSLQACQAVCAMPDSSVYGIELDVQVSRDGIPFLYHDRYLGKEKRQRMDLFRMKSSQIRPMSQTRESGTTPPPTLEEILVQVDHRKTLFLELKDYGVDVDHYCRCLLPVLEDYHPDYDVVLHSFSAPLMTALLAQTAHLRVRYGFLFLRCKQVDALPREVFRRLDYLHPWFMLPFWNSRTLCKYAKPLNLWTLNSRRLLERLSHNACGHLLHGVMSDLPHLLAAPLETKPLPTAT